MENEKKQVAPEELDKVSGGKMKVVLTGQDAEDYMRQRAFGGGYSGGYSGGWY